MFPMYKLRERRRKRSWAQQSSPGGSPVNQPPKQQNPVIWFISNLFTFVAFASACFLTPWLIFLYLVVRTCRSAWVGLLEKKFPGLEFVRGTTPRTAVDTIRNQGIITLLLQVKGPCQINLIKTRVQEGILKKCNKDGVTVYPHLKTVLCSRWGRYAWMKGSEKSFQLDNHILMGHSSFKGRAVSEANIQEYVSDVVSKLLPPELPPWQVIIVPSQTGFYLLIRLHHLYLSEDSLALGDLLMLREDSAWEQTMAEDHDDSQHILAGTFNHPVVIPQVYQQISESLSNYWNELIYQYDTEQALKLQPDLPIICIRILIAAVSSLSAIYKQESLDITKAVGTEFEKRHISVSVVVESVVRSMAPVHAVKLGFQLWLKCTKLLLNVPLLLLHLVRDTPVYLYWLYLMHYVVQETWYLVTVLYTAPRVLFEEIFLPEYPCNVHRLQTLSLCGRKVVAWSDPVPSELIEGITRASGASTCEVLLSATASSLREYFEKVGFAVPDAVMTTSRFMPQQHLFLGSTPPGSCGMLCLPLPTNTPRSSPLVSLRALQNVLYNARSKQAALYLASVYQLDYNLFTTIFPSVFARACLYLLSRRYAVTLTQVDSTSGLSETKPRQLIWGPEVESIMYWRPPQANVCLSLTLMSYGGNMQLGVMADAQLAPQHSFITKGFTESIYELAAVTRVPTGIPPAITSSSRSRTRKNNE